MPDFAPSIRPCVLYQREAKNGNMYLAGRWGGLKIAVVKTSKTTEDGQAIWNLLLSEIPRDAPSLKDKVAASYDDMLTKSDDEVPY